MLTLKYLLLNDEGTIIKNDFYISDKFGETEVMNERDLIKCSCCDYDFGEQEVSFVKICTFENFVMRENEYYYKPVCEDCYEEICNVNKSSLYSYVVDISEFERVRAEKLAPNIKEPEE